MNTDTKKKKMTFKIEFGHNLATISIEQHIELDEVFRLILGETGFNFYESELGHEQTYRSHSIKCSRKMGEAFLEIMKITTSILTEETGEVQIFKYNYNPN